MKRYGYDLEVFKNFFSAMFVDIVTKEVKCFVLWSDGTNSTNDMVELLEFLKEENWLVGYNSSKYDDLILNCILVKEEEFLNESCEFLLDGIYDLSQKIIQNSRDRVFYKANPTKYLCKVKHKYKGIDLMSLLGLDKKMVGLKQVSVNMKWNRIQDLPKKFDEEVSKDEIESILEYNRNDVDITIELYNRAIDEVKLRYDVGKQYNVDIISSSRSGMADKLMSKMYADKSGTTYWDFKDIRDRNNIVAFKDIIWNKVKFTTKPLQDLLETLKNTTVVCVKGRKDFKERVVLNECAHEMAKGGLHSKVPSMVVEENSEYVLRDLDFGSFYPNIMLMLKVRPPGLGKPFLEVLETITTQRLKAKKEGLLVDSEALKIVINSVYGKLGFEHGYMYSPKAMYQVTINGQLILLKMIELLETEGIRCFYSNTDGATFKVPRDKEELFYEVANKYSAELNIPIEFANYKKCVIRDVNNYSITTCDGEVKAKGMFSTKIALDKGYDMPIIAIALHNYFVEGIPVEDTIKKHSDIYDFCKAQKVGAQFKIEYHSLVDSKHDIQICQKTNRYFVSKSGGKLYKRKVTNDKIEDLVAGNSVKLFNDYYESDDYGVDFGYYIKKTKEVINTMEPQQVSLF